MSPHFLSDQPAENDLLSFDRYSTPLVDAIADPATVTPFSIGVFGAWGSGKSTLLKRIRDELPQRKGLDFHLVDFNPWLYRSEETLLIPLVYALEGIIEDDPSKKIKDAAKEAFTVVAKSLTKVGVGWLIKTATAGAYSLDDVEKFADPFLKQRKESISAIQTLRSDLQKVVDALTNNGKSKRIVFFIDDLDRCSPDQIIDLLESVKLFLDLKHCVFVLALDREVVQQGIHIRYHEFEFDDERGYAIGSEYMEKMIQLPLTIYPLADSEVSTFVKDLDIDAETRGRVESLISFLPANPRKIKRIVNLFLLHLHMAGEERLAELKLEVLARLIVLQIRNPRLFRHLSEYPELAEYLPKVFKGRVRVQDKAGWPPGGPRSDRLRELCALYSTRGGWVERMFTEGVNLPSGESLAAYVRVLGSPPVT